MLTGTADAGNLTGTCVARVDEGPCTWDHECVPGRFCSHGTCKPLLHIGDACGDDTNGCGGFSACDSESASPTCVHAGLVGERCAPLYGVPSICRDGSACNDRLRCVSPVQFGEACSPGTCAPSLYCSGTCFQCPSPDAGQ